MLRIAATGYGCAIEATLRPGTAMPLETVLLPCRADNYAVLLHHAESGETAVVDTPDGAVIEAELDRRGWRLTHILTTHHHGDHTEGHARLTARFGCAVIAPAAEADRIPGTTQKAVEGTTLHFAGRDVLVIATPGHTKGHVAYYMPSEDVVFVGDTLFAMGCGRLFEDTPQAMWSSLSKLGDLPPRTLVYCGHEYTASNARFARSIEPDNPDTKRRADEVAAARARGEPTVPTSIGLELLTNPFLRADQPGVKAALAMADAPPVAVFAELRARKDRF